MYISLVEILHAASDIETKKKYNERRVLATYEDTEDSRRAFHRWRLAGIRVGLNLQVVRTAHDPNAPQNRAQRRFQDRLLRRLFKRLSKPQKEVQRRVDEEVDQHFEERASHERRRAKRKAVASRRT